MASLHDMLLKPIATSWSALATSPLKRNDRYGDISTLGKCHVPLRTFCEKVRP